MNIFVILIMGIMLATYQYFMTKRSSDVTLNKDELRLQADLTCMKQYHDFATAKNEYLYDTKNTVVSLKGTGEDQVNYTCTGSDDPTFKVSKYCLDANGLNRVDCSFEGISCANTSDVNTPGYHCVSTTKWKVFDKKDKYLISQILKQGVNISYQDEIQTQGQGQGQAQNQGQGLGNGLYLLKDKAAIFADKPQAKENEVVTGMGLVSCVNACKVSLQTKLSGAGCPEGMVIVAKDDGSFECAKPTDASACTAHEKESDISTSEAYCTPVRNGLKYCCAIDFYHNVPDGPKEGKLHYNKNRCEQDPRPYDCCPPGTIPYWGGSGNAGSRFYECKDLNSFCNTGFPMKVVDEKGNPLSVIGDDNVVKTTASATGESQIVNIPAVFKIDETDSSDEGIPLAKVQYKFDYSKKVGTYYCHLSRTAVVESCKKLQGKNYSFLKVSEITNSTNIVESDFKNRNLNYAPVCHLASKANAKAAENCTPCQGVEFDKLNNKWKCVDYSWNGEKGRPSIVGNHEGSDVWNVIFGKDAKGRQSCLSTCTPDMINKIKSGVRYGTFWGLRYDEKSHMWNCFTCNPCETYNYLWRCNGGAPKNCVSISTMTDISNYEYEGKQDEEGQIKTGVCNFDSGKRNSDEGKCIPFDCASDFQVQINGECYTKWCSRASEGFPAGANIGAPKESTCPEDTPWMVYNQQRTCVYCIRPPANRPNI